MDTSRFTWRTTLLITAAIGLTLATGLIAGQFLQSYDQSVWFELEANRIAEVLQVRPGGTVGDVRAGTGRWSVDLAARVGPEGQIYATAGPTPAHVLFATVAESGLDNVSVITRTPGEAGRLPLDCCDAILLRHVYRNFSNREALLGQLIQNVRPGGRLAVIEFLDSGQTSPGLQTNRVPPAMAIAELRAAGFEMVEMIDDWSDNTYCVVFSRPSSPPSSTS